MGSSPSELRNGTLYDGNPTGLWNGVVKLELYNASTKAWIPCSGQVVSAQSILTAAHCITAATPGNPNSVYAKATRPAPGGGWKTVMPNTLAYVKYNPAYNQITAKNDVGLVIAPSVQLLQNVYLGDAVPLAKSSPNIAMTTLGFGYYEADKYDGLGRSAVINPTYDASEHEYEFTGQAPDGAQHCRGDSGGPIKTTAMVYGILSLGEGVVAGKCSSQSRFATTMDNMAWLKANIVKKSFCSDSATSYSCW